jgi:hypothetical protein
MSTDLTIPKEIVLPKACDYAFLRKEGIAYIERLSNRVWTDYNIHDPGITIIEVLCYAITDVSNRTTFNIKDLLTRLPKEKKKDFFTASEILTCNPVTITDLKKFIIDQEGIQNAWLNKLKYAADCNCNKSPKDNCCCCYNNKDPFEDMPAFYYQCDKFGKGYVMEINSFSPGSDKINEPVLPKYLSGLYNVTLELEENSEFGDLNSNIIEWFIPTGNQKKKIKIAFPFIEIFFPDWNQDSINKILEDSSIPEVTADYNDITEEIDLTFAFDTFTLQYKRLKVSLENDNIPDSKTEIENELEFQTGTRPSLCFDDFFSSRLRKIITLIKNVYCNLQCVRNLCEDFVKFRIARFQDIVLCAEIEVTLESDLEEVLAQVYFEVDRFLAPPVRFYNWQELYDKGLRTEKIFEGPKLTHGFIIEEELKDCELKDEIHISDLYRIIMSISGVKKILSLQITNYLNGVAQTTGELWCVHLGGSYALNLNLAKSKVTFYKSNLPFYADKKQVNLLVRTLKAKDGKPKFLDIENDLPLPDGEYKNLEEFYSVQNDFPDVYKTGRNGITYIDSQERIAKAKQLKAFLIFFDQFLIDYLGQLNLGKDLLSMDSSIIIDQTFRTLPVYDIPSTGNSTNFFYIPNLLRQFTEFLSPSINLDRQDEFKTSWESFANNENNSFREKVNEFAEDEEKYYERMNVFLDHLIARFSETFGDYTHIIQQIEGIKNNDELLSDKRSFLHDYPTLSSERGKGFVYKCCECGKEIYEKNVEDLSVSISDKNKCCNCNGLDIEAWPGNNITGLQRRVSRLLGIDDLIICNDNLTESDLQDEFIFINAPDSFSFTIKKFNWFSGIAYSTQADRLRDIKFIIRRSINLFNYKIDFTSGFKISIIDENGIDIITSNVSFSSFQKALKKIRKFISFIKTKYYKHEALRKELSYTDSLNDHSDILTYINILPEDGTSNSNHRFIISTNNILYLESLRNDYSYNACLDAIKYCLNLVFDNELFEVNLLPDGKYTFSLFDRRIDCAHNRIEIAFYNGPPIQSEEEAWFKIQQLIEYITSGQLYREGMHVVENILLRPFSNTIPEVILNADVNNCEDLIPIDNTISDLSGGMFPMCKLENDCACPVEDYYSFRINIVLPFWPKRFRNMNFRKYAERIIREETPAHIVVKICWVDNEDMKKFEKYYKLWLLEISKFLPGEVKLATDKINLIKAISELNNVYPQGVLHDCDNPSKQESIILNQSSLGTF